MSNSPIVPCLWFDDEAEEAAAFYIQAFREGRIDAASHYPEGIDTPSGKPSGSVLTVGFEIAGQRFTALNGGPEFVKNPAISFFVHVDTAEEANRLYAKLEEGGKGLMAIGPYPWSERYGWIEDRFGVSWQVIAGRRPEGSATIVPCLMFSGAVGGKAQEAIETYSRIFPESRVESLVRYEKSEGPEAFIKHGRFRLGSQQMIAMDSYVEHGFAFNEGISMQVLCGDQDEIDRYWTALSEGGKPGRCGWLTDRFGLSFQVVPARLAEWMGSPNQAARARAFEAILGMSKLSIAVIEKAFEGP